MGQNTSWALLLALNGGAILGALVGSRFAGRFGPKPVVATCFLIGAIFIGLVGVIASTLPDKPGPDDIAGQMLALTLTVIAFAGVGTLGAQILLFGFVANYFRTNVRVAAVTWAAEFGRLGGVGGPLLGAVVVAAGLAALHPVFYILAGLALFGMLLTLLVPASRASHVIVVKVGPTPEIG